MTPRRLHFSTRTWFQLCLLPALAAVTLGLSWSVYQSLREIILGGFEKKLVAVSTSLAAFVPPEDHAWLMHQPVITGLAFAPDGILFALDRSRQVLMRIRDRNGIAEEQTVPVPAGLSDLAYDTETGRLLALELPGGRVFTLDPRTGAAEPRLTIGAKARGLVFADGIGVLVLADRLLRVNLEANRAEPVSDFLLPPILGAGYDGDRHTIWAVDSKRRLLRIDPTTGRVKLHLRLAEDTLLPGDLAYDRRHKLLTGATTSIVRIDLETGRIEPAHFVAAFGKELSPVYQSYAVPMRRIMHELDLTYLYTITVTDGDRITYGLDGTPGEKHSPLQSQDRLPATQAAGIEELMRSGALYVAPIQKWQQWGRLKTVFAPIFDPVGRPAAIAGADVELGVIEQQTRRALFQLLAIGVGSLLLASAVSFRIAHHLRQPLEQIKSMALDVAAGNYARRVTIETPQEARVLGQVFNQVADALERSMAALQSSIRDLLGNRDRYELARRLGQPHDPVQVLAGLPGVSAEWRDPTTAAACASGAAHVGERTVLWFATSPDDPLAAARRRADLALRVTARLQSSTARPITAALPGQTIAPFAAPRARLGTLPEGVLLAVAFASDRIVHVFAAPGTSMIDAGNPNIIQLSDGELTVTLTGFTFESNFA